MDIENKEIMNIENTDECWICRRFKSKDLNIKIVDGITTFSKIPVCEICYDLIDTIGMENVISHEKDMHD